MDRAETTALLREAREGSRPALERLLERCAPRLLVFIRVRLGRGLRAHLESGDILNASLLKAFRGLERFEESDGPSLMAWLARIADNEIRDQADYHGAARRDAARVTQLGAQADELAAEVRSQTSRIVLDESLERLARVLESLEPGQREVIVLRRLEERSYREIAERLGKTPDACRMMYARAMAALTFAWRQTR